MQGKKIQFSSHPLPWYCPQAVAVSLFLKNKSLLLISSPVAALSLLHTTAKNRKLDAADLKAAHKFLDQLLACLLFHVNAYFLLCELVD